jgi:hypothetical protein
MAGEMRVSAVGVPWYKRADYKRILEIMADAEKLPLTFDKWQKLAEQLEAAQKRTGMTVVRAHLDPEKFVAWCAANGLDVDSHARNRWASEAAYRAVTGEH